MKSNNILTLVLVSGKGGIIHPIHLCPADIVGMYTEEDPHFLDAQLSEVQLYLKILLLQLEVIFFYSSGIIGVSHQKSILYSYSTICVDISYFPDEPISCTRPGSLIRICSSRLIFPRDGNGRSRR